MINAVVGPAKADKLLTEARWAVDTYQQAQATAGKNPFAQMQIIAQAHAAQTGDRTHQMLAENPLVPLPMIQQQVFEKLAGQKASQDRSTIALAAAGFAQAEQKGRPVLLVLTSANSKPGDRDIATARLLAALNTRPISTPVRNCVLVILPIDELPALTNLVNLPEVELAERQTPAVVLTGSDGVQLGAISSQSTPAEVVQQIWDAVNQTRLAKAEKLIASGKPGEAAGLLKLVKASVQAGPLKELAAARLAELQPAPQPQSPKSPTKPPADDSPKKLVKSNPGSFSGPGLVFAGSKRKPASKAIPPAYRAAEK